MLKGEFKSELREIRKPKRLQNSENTNNCLKLISYFIKITKHINDISSQHK